MQNPIEQKANPFALDSNTNVEYDAEKWRLRGTFQPEMYKKGAGENLIWKARKVPLAEPGKYYFTADQISRAELDKYEAQEKEMIEQVKKESAHEDQLIEDGSSPEALAKGEEDNGDVEELARVSGVSAEEIRKHKYPRRK